MTIVTFGGPLLIGGGVLPPTPAKYPLAGVCKIQVSFTAPFATPVWTDITKYAMGFSTSGPGRQHEQQQVNPSTASITLYNGPVSSADPGGRFSPWNTASPYYHSGLGLVPTRPVRITGTWNGTTYPVFYGYAKAWTPVYGLTRSSLTLTCYDILGLLNLDTLDTGQYVTTLLGTSPEAFWRCNDPIGSRTFADSSGNGNTGTVEGTVNFGAAGPLLTETDTAASMGPGMMNTPITPLSSGTVMFAGWFQSAGGGDQVIMDWPAGATAGVLFGTNLAILASGEAAIVNGAEGAAPSSMSVFVNGPDVADGKFHYYVVEVPCGSSSAGYSLWVDGVSYGTSVSASPFTFADFTFSASGRYIAFGPSVFFPFPAFTGTMGEVAYWTTPLTTTQIAQQFQIGSATWLVQDSGARINAVLDVCNIPAGLNNVGPGIIQCQGATSALNTTTAMSYLNTVVNTERGLLFQDATGVLQFFNRQYVYTNPTSTTSQATFGYITGQFHFLASGFVPLEDDTDLWNNIPVQATNGVVQTASDLTSQTAYGRRTLTGYTNLLFIHDAESSDLAAGLLYQYKNPATRVRAIVMDSNISGGANMPQMLGRGLLDRITINWRPMDGSTVDFSQQSLIEQVSHTVTPEVWTTNFAVTPIGTEHFFIVGTDKVGTGIIGF